MTIPLPPRELMFDGPPDAFIENGLEFFGYYKDICGLKPSDCMLDVGCGIGRKTIPLVDYLTDGVYEGFDCKEEGIDWCRNNITTRYPNFNFLHFDLYAPGYNPSGTVSPLDFRFPYGDNCFDFVVAASVFTHTQYDVMLHYLKDICRVMRPGAKCLITYFLWPISEPRKEFFYPLKYGWCANADMPEQAICFDEDMVKIEFMHVGFTDINVYPGYWSKGSEGLSYQDIIVASK